MPAVGSLLGDARPTSRRRDALNRLRARGVTVVLRAGWFAVGAGGGDLEQSGRRRPVGPRESDVSQNSVCTRTAKLRGGASAVPENRPAKLMTLSRLVRLTVLA